MERKRSCVMSSGSTAIAFFFIPQSLAPYSSLSSFSYTGAASFSKISDVALTTSF